MHYSPRPKKTSHYMSSLGSLETVSEEPKSKQHEPGGTGGSEGAFALERVKHETGGVFGPEGATSEELEPEKAFVPESEADESGEDSSDDEGEPELDQGGQSGAHQKVTAAALSESEYVALEEVVNELRFLRQVKSFLMPPIDNIIFREDNEGAIKMATNHSSSRRTRHVDVKHHIVRDAVESGVVRIHYVKSGKQHADVLMKA